METMYQAIAENARHRYDYLDDSEITLNTLMDFKRVLQAIQGRNAVFPTVILHHQFKRLKARKRRNSRRGRQDNRHA